MAAAVHRSCAWSIRFLEIGLAQFTRSDGVAEAELEIVCISGSVPGPITATVSHLGDVRSVGMEVAPHPSGGWHARLWNNANWGLRCHAVPTAIMLEAAEIFIDEPMLMAAD